MVLHDLFAYVEGSSPVLLLHVTEEGLKREGTGSVGGAQSTNDIKVRYLKVDQ